MRTDEPTAFADRVDALDYAEGQVINAEDSLEEAIIACPDADIRAELMGTYRGLIVTLIRLRGIERAD